MKLRFYTSKAFYAFINVAENEFRRRREFVKIGNEININTFSQTNEQVL